MEAVAATVKDMARTGERCVGRGGSRVLEWRVKKRKSGCCLGTPSDEAFAVKFQPELGNQICFRGFSSVSINFAHDFEISAIKPPRRRERNARTVSSEVGT
jgi:hypothetical protein